MFSKSHSTWFYLFTLILQRNLASVICNFRMENSKEVRYWYSKFKLPHFALCVQQIYRFTVSFEFQILHNFILNFLTWMSLFSKLLRVFDLQKRLQLLSTLRSFRLFRILAQNFLYIVFVLLWAGPLSTVSMINWNNQSFKYIGFSFLKERTQVWLVTSWSNFPVSLSAYFFIALSCFKLNKFYF